MSNVGHLSPPALLAQIFAGSLVLPLVIPLYGQSQSGLVLVVPEVCAGGHGAGRVRNRSPRGEERLVGRSAAVAAVGVAEEERALVGRMPGYKICIPCRDSFAFIKLPASNTLLSSKSLLRQEMIAF